MASAFVDESQVHVKGGNGGAGAVSFRREAHVSRGGPDGGDGGRGGNVYLEATTNLASLLSFVDHPHRRAGDGGHGGGKKLHGRNGTDLLVPVPVGTIVRHPNGDVLADLTASGDRYMAAAGGRGGRGNARFLSNRSACARLRGAGRARRGALVEPRARADGRRRSRRVPQRRQVHARVDGSPPPSRRSPTIRSRPSSPISASCASEATSRQDAAAVEFVVADIPGLIEGASEGRGLGHKFLRHVERARVLLVLADLGEDEGRAPAEQVRILLEELRRYRPELLDRPRIIVGSRADRRPSELAPCRCRAWVDRRQPGRVRDRARDLGSDRRRAASSARPARRPGRGGPRRGARAPAAQSWFTVPSPRA